MSRLLKPLALGLVVALSGLLAIVVAPWIDFEQQYGLPWMFWARGPVRVPNTVAIVAIDEQSSASLEVPQRPHDWPRTLHAELVRYLSRAGARLIVFDMTFDTPSPQPAHDEELAAAFAAAGNVLVSESVRMDVLPLDDSKGKGLASVVVERAAAPTPVIAQTLLGSAPFLLPKAARVDAYWTFRHGAKDAPTLPVLALRYWTAVGTPGAGAPSGAEQQRVAATLARLEAEGDLAYLNLYGPPGSIRTLSYAQVLHSARAHAGTDGAPIDDAGLRGKAVFVGVFANTPAGQDRLRDDHRTVFSQDDGLNLSGVEIAATAFANLLDGRPLRPLSVAAQMGIAALWAVVLGVTCGLLRPWIAAAATGVLATAWLGLVLDRFTYEASWWPAIVPIGVQWPLALFIGVWLQYRSTRRDREHMKEAIGYYLPQSVVNQFDKGARATDHANRVVYGTCLATDVGHYTSLAESMDPTRLGKLLNAYYAELFVPVERSGGIVVDVVGDAMVALWTASATTSNVAVRRSACGAALEIVAALDRFNRASVDRPRFDTRFGLHCGDVLVGNVGASRHFEYRAVGDIINTASRLEGLNKLLGTRLLASASTLEGLDEMQTRPVGSFRLAGKANAVAVVELLGRASAVDADCRRMCAQFGQALDLYVAGRLRDAAEGFDLVLSEWPGDGPSRFYSQRCATLLAAPGEGDWSPTITLASK